MSQIRVIAPDQERERLQALESHGDVRNRVRRARADTRMAAE